MQTDSALQTGSALQTDSALQTGSALQTDSALQTTFFIPARKQEMLPDLVWDAFGPHWASKVGRPCRPTQPRKTNSPADHQPRRPSQPCRPTALQTTSPADHNFIFACKQEMLPDLVRDVLLCSGPPKWADRADQVSPTDH